MNQPNVLYLHSHDTGRYTSPYGYAVDTPNLQRLAERGVLFRQAFCNNPTCSPSRACLLTGRYAHTNGMMGLAHRGGRLDDPRQTLGNVLRDAGYLTAIAGLQHLTGGAEPLSMDVLGYTLDPDALTRSVSAPEGLPRDELAVERAVAFLKERAGGSEPFFLDIGFFATHRTETTDDGVQWHNDKDSPVGDTRYVRPPAPLPDTPETRADFADYAVAVARLDGYYGRVLDALDAAGLADQTLVVCTTDHGIAFPHMKCNLTDHGLGVGLTLAGVGFDGGRVIDPMVCHLDVLPTVCELAGIDPPDGVQGVSLTPLLDRPGRPVRDAVFAEVNYHAAHEPQRAVRTERYKYIRRFPARPHPVLPNCDDSVSRNVLLERGWADRPQTEEQLYDLTFDPNEARNVVDDPAYADAADEMRRRLEGWMRDTDDPALAGRVELPGFMVNPVDAESYVFSEMSITR
ncbi:MAG: sulfatase [Planctomycetota bacterium]